jgi:hypothetical protein
LGLRSFIVFARKGEKKRPLLYAESWMNPAEMIMKLPKPAVTFFGAKSVKGFFSHSGHSTSMID